MDKRIRLEGTTVDDAEVISAWRAKPVPRLARDIIMMTLPDDKDILDSFFVLLDILNFGQKGNPAG